MKEGLAPLTFVNQDKTQIISCGILLVYVAESGSEVESTEEKTDRYGFA